MKEDFPCGQESRDSGDGSAPAAGAAGAVPPPPEGFTVYSSGILAWSHTDRPGLVQYCHWCAECRQWVPGTIIMDLDIYTCRRCRKPLQPQPYQMP